MTYKTDLKKFRQCTRLELFCRAEGSDSEDNGTDDDPPPGFRKIVVRHKWPNTVTLEDVEKFRKRYMRKYDLQKCAMMLHSIRPGSFRVTWFVPVTVIDILRKKRAVKVYKEFEVSRLEIYVQATAVCVYQTTVQRQVSFMQFTVKTSTHVLILFNNLGRLHLFLHLPAVLHQLSFCCEKVTCLIISTSHE